MIHGWSRWAGLAVALPILAGCGEKELATEHIRSVLGGTVPASAEPAGLRAPEAAVEASEEVADAPVLSLPNGDTLHVDGAVAEYYAARGYVPLWTDHDELLPEGLQLLEALAQADREGLDRERYHYSTAHRMARILEEGEAGDAELEYLGNLDLLLTESFSRLARDLTIGTIDPRPADLEWMVPRSDPPGLEPVRAVVSGRDPQEVLASLRPAVPYYDRLIRALARLRSIEQRGGWGALPEGETLSEGDAHPRVAALRARLLAGDDSEEAQLARVGAGRAEVLDPELVRALERFQARHELHEDGALGPNTLAALNVPVEERIEQVRLNLDRWRWLPRHLGELYLLVNVAGFELELVERDTVLESMKVVVGATANRTPIFHDTLEYIVVNPYWNVPASIAEEEILPLARENPGYLERNNYEVVHEGSDTRIRQRPGRDNALGNVKFLFPNDMDIYLHDTPANHLFSQKTRAFSHGCIRLERADDLARLLLERLTDLEPSEYDRLRQASGEQWIPVDRKIPVYLLYFTAWVGEDGVIRFHPDVYERDRTLAPEAERQLGSVRPRPIVGE